MYIVTIKNGDISTEIHGRTEKLTSGKIVKGINAIDSFSFSLLPSNAGFSLINEYSTLVSAWNTRKNRYDFVGRVLYPETSMDSDGLISKDVTCESVFGYLCDSQQPYVATKNWTVSGLLNHLIDNHNAQVEDYKKFTVGMVTAMDANDNLYLGISRENTWNAIKTNLLDKIGGELQFRVEGETLYIDYLEQIGETRATEIALSVNMKSITREQDPSAYVTRLIPLGAKLSNDTEERLDITSVNNGLNYIDDSAAIAVYGIHVGYVTFDDVTTASSLKTKGANWLADNNKVQVKYSITALDLSLLDLAIDDFEVGNYHPIKNALLGIDDTARIIKKTIDVCEEVKSTIEVGDNFKTLSDIQREQEEQIKYAAQNITIIQKTTNELKDSVSVTQQTVSDLQDSLEIIGGAEIGATNLLPGSRTMEKWVTSYGGSSLSIDNDGFGVLTWTDVDALAWRAIRSYEPIQYTRIRDKTITLSFWARSTGENAAKIQAVLDVCTATSTARTLYSWLFTTTELSTEWEKYSVTTTVTDAIFTSGTGTIDDTSRIRLCLYDYTLYGAEVKKVKLELGSVATDWSPAPEDGENALADATADLKQTILTQETRLTNTCTEIILAALESYVETSNYEEFKETVESQLSIMADEIVMNFTTTTEQIVNVDGDLQTKYEQICKYLTFNDNGITIGSGDNAITLTLDNETGITFSRNGIAFGKWDGVNFYTGNIVVAVNERAQFGNFAFVPRSDGSLMLLKVGG